MRMRVNVSDVRAIWLLEKGRGYGTLSSSNFPNSKISGSEVVV
jgi:hypothetical protein